MAESNTNFLTSLLRYSTVNISHMGWRRHYKTTRDTRDVDKRQGTRSLLSIFDSTFPFSQWEGKLLGNCHHDHRRRTITEARTRLTGREREEFIAASTQRRGGGSEGWRRDPWQLSAPPPPPPAEYYEGERGVTFWWKREQHIAGNENNLLRLATYNTILEQLVYCGCKREEGGSGGRGNWELTPPPPPPAEYYEGEKGLTGRE